MAADLQKTLQEAERALKSGKADSAVAQLQRYAKRCPSDSLALNRIGDLLARSPVPVRITTRNRTS